MYLSDIHTHSIASGHGTPVPSLTWQKQPAKRTETPWDSDRRPGNSRLPELLLISEASFLSQKKIRHRYSLRS